MAEDAASMWSQSNPPELDLGFEFDWFPRELSPLPPTSTELDLLFPNDIENAHQVLGSDSSACVYSSSSTGPSSPNPRENNCADMAVGHSSHNCVKTEANGRTMEISHENGNQDPDQNPHSDSDPKRLTRLIKNREAASQSRKRKKSYVQDLESKCRMWENYCNQLQQSIAFTCAENAILRDELNRCKRQKSSNVVAEPAVHKDSLPLESPSRLTTLVDAGHLTVVRCLGWLVVALILLFPGKGVKSKSTIFMTRTKTEFNSSIFRVFFNLLQKRRVFESFPVTRNRAFSSCRHHNWMLNYEFSPSYCVCYLA